MSDQTSIIFLAIFPLFFIGMWLAVTLLLGLFSGWFSLQSRYPNNDEPALLKLSRQSGSMGAGVAMNGILKLSACPSGLRIGIWRMFGLFQRPFLVPWDEITATSKTMFFMPMARLSLGHPNIGNLTIDARSWERLSAHSPAKARRGDEFEPVTSGQMVHALLLQWALISAGGAVFFTIVSQLVPDSAPVPVVMFAFLPVVFGVVQCIRYIQMRF